MPVQAPGSIPAHTGKPGRSRPPPPRPRVYPRPHGEARSCATARRTEDGLSPPTRGSRRARRTGNGGGGSIPAHTGKPCHRLIGPAKATVYPRPHGEATASAVFNTLVCGLSPPTPPPTRGSLFGIWVPEWVTGSIPAHTGKPCHLLAGGDHMTVYPRPHGEATVSPGSPLTETGLSPPTRGSRATLTWATTSSGSIPAHTGKPALSSATMWPTRVYPRPHGEASRACT